MREFNKLIKACPAGLYKLDDAGNIHLTRGPPEMRTRRFFCGTLENGNTRRERSALPSLRLTPEILDNDATAPLFGLPRRLMSFVLIEQTSQ